MPDSLRDTTWELDGPIHVPDGVGVTLVFGESDVSGMSGCNRFRGAYRYADGELSFGPLAGTMMMCRDDAMVVEHEVLARLASTTRVVHDTATLTLLGADGAVVLQYRAQSPASVLGTWTVNGIHHPEREAIISTRGELTVEFADDRVSGNAGCNQFNGSFAFDGSAVTIGPLMSTRRFCDDPEAGSGPTLMEQEAALLAALHNAVGLRLEGERLTLLRPDGGIAVTLHRA